MLKLSGSVRKTIENLAYVLKRKKSTSLFKLIYKNARLILKLVLHKYNIELNYILMNGNKNSPEFLIISSITGLISDVSLELQWRKAGITIFEILIILLVILANGIKNN